MPFQPIFLTPIYQFYNPIFWPFDFEDKCLEWISEIPQGFSCGVGAPGLPGCYLDRFVSVDCSEIFVKTALYQGCEDGQNEDECFSFPNWT